MRGNQVVIVRIDGEIVKAFSWWSRQVELCDLFERLAGRNRRHQSRREQGGKLQEPNAGHSFFHSPSQSHNQLCFTVMPTIPDPRMISGSGIFLNRSNRSSETTAIR